MTCLTFRLSSLFLSLCLGMGFFVFSAPMTYAATNTSTVAASSSSQSMDDHALEQSKSLYCSVKGAITGDVGLLIGLLISCWGLLSLIFGGFSAGAFLLIIFGILITSLPAWFEIAYANLEKLTTPLGSGNTTITPGC